VKSTRKITKAMELVAASKMRRAVSGVLGTRPYTTLAWETVRAVARVSDPSHHPLLAARAQTRRVLFVVYTSDRGLCGGYNARLVKEAQKAIGVEQAEVEVVAVGRRGGASARRAKKEIVAAFQNLTNNPSFADTLPISKLILDGYLSERYDRVVMVYTDYISAITQIPRVLDLLPLKPDDDLGSTGSQLPMTNDQLPTDYLFEPSPAAVLDFILPRIVETMVWQALLESAASEHSARMMAMRSASDSAKEMIEDLTFTFNQIRQAGITREIAEISSGKAALE
jgi:F-type H+-transporting ATPase subunit gamma